ncbi:MAG TPA: DUF4870 domain-containing protein, partial [Terriglobales bacterium]|nr:DUF4870 domain-containing protein [Terriglobales bacterium]
MSASPQCGALEPSQDERTFAVLAHVLQVVAWWIAPLVIFIMKRDSKFTSFHALQALLLQAFYMILMGVFTIFWFAGFFLVMLHMPTDKSAPPPTALFRYKQTGLSGAETSRW